MDGSAEGVHRNRLQQDLANTHFMRPPSSESPKMAGNENDGKAWTDGEQLSSKFRPAQSRHRKVGYDQVVPPGSGSHGVQRFYRIGAGLDLVTQQLEYFLTHGNERLLVIDVQETLALAVG